VAQAHHALFDVGRLEVEQDRHHGHQIAVLELLVLELPQQVPGGLPDDLAAARVAVFVGEGVDALQQFVRHRDADDSHVLTQGRRGSRTLLSDGPWRADSIRSEKLTDGFINPFYEPSVAGIVSVPHSPNSPSARTCSADSNSHWL
jgi:hypothetical protein